MIIEKLRPTRLVSSDADQEIIPVRIVQMSSGPSELCFYTGLLAVMGALLRPRLRSLEIEQ